MRFLGLIITIQFLSSTLVLADTVTVRVLSKTGEPVHSAIISAGAPRDTVFDTKAGETEALETEARMDQIDREFAPYVLPVHKGQKVAFPNKDSVRHHVYSFSEAKPFELRLYSGRPADPIEFNKPGTVVLGCNIHDNMVGYIYVTNRPFKATTNQAGDAQLSVDQAVTDITLWHPKLSLDSQAELNLVLAELPQVEEQGETIYIVNLEIATPAENPQAAQSLEDRFKRFNFE